MGFTQKKGIDYYELFAPVAKYSTIPIMLAFAVQKELGMLLLDVQAAFLNSELDDAIFTEQPERCLIKGKEKNCVLTTEGYLWFKGSLSCTK